MQSTKIAVFKVGEEEYGFDIMDVNTIENYMDIEPKAKLSKNFKGVINLRGDVIPVYSLRRKFNLEDIPASDSTRFIITTSNGNLIAYEIDQMSEIIQFEGDQIFEVPDVVKSKDTSYMKKITSLDDRLITILNGDGILSEEEQNIKSMLN